MKTIRWYETDYGSAFLIFCACVAISAVIIAIFADGCNGLRYRLRDVPWTETPEVKARFELETK